MRFRKVKIVRGQEVIEYDENLQDWRKHVIVNPSQLKYGQYVKYRNSWKKPGQRLKLENVRWFVLDAVTGEKITRCDSIEQAKRFCIKNSYDFGMF